jgi:hypothetical protein
MTGKVAIAHYTEGEAISLTSSQSAKSRSNHLNGALFPVKPSSEARKFAHESYREPTAGVSGVKLPALQRRMAGFIWKRII